MPESTFSSADPTDLLSPLHDVDQPPARFDLNSNDALVFGVQPAPWHPVKTSTTADGDVYEHVRPSLTNCGDHATEAVVDQHPDLGLVEGHIDGQCAHSSTNGISQWEDLSTDHEPTVASHIGHPVDSTTISSSPASVWSANNRLSQSSSPITTSSQQDAGPTSNAGGSNPHVCPSCGKSFSSRSGVR